MNATNALVSFGQENQRWKPELNTTQRLIITHSETHYKGLYKKKYHSHSGNINSRLTFVIEMISIIQNILLMSRYQAFHSQYTKSDG